MLNRCPISLLLTDAAVIWSTSGHAQFVLLFTEGHSPASVNVTLQ
jgi:hypothetical protein